MSGSFSQSVLQRNLSQLSQPIGGVRASPLSNALTFVIDDERASNINITVILLTQLLIIIDEIFLCFIAIADAELNCKDMNEKKIISLETENKI